MEEKVKLSMLCQIYGKMLTKKQYEIINDYCNNDLSLSEIAENNSITRQAVRDIIRGKETFRIRRKAGIYGKDNDTGKTDSRNINRTKQNRKYIIRQKNSKNFKPY